MMHWAQHKLQTDVPTLVGPTSTMLLKAEARTISALLNSKSQAQTKQIMIAAYRCAGLQDPFLPRQESLCATPTSASRTPSK